jgi:hypothetical protein
MSTKLTDQLLAEALKAGHIQDKQTKIAKGAFKDNLYSFPTVYSHIQKAGCNVKPAAVRQRIYAVNKAMAEAGIKQKWKAKRDFTGRKKKELDTSLFTV